VNIIKKLLRNLSWVSVPDVKPVKKRQLATIVVSRNQYQEYKRSYKVSIPDLYRVIQNECKMMNRPGHIIVWMLLPKRSESFDVVYAVVPRALLAGNPAQLQLVIPETWLFYSNLAANILYVVNAEQPYWAFLSNAGILHVTAQQGLMQNPDYFLEALGATEAAIEKRSIDIPNYFQQNDLTLSWWQLPGLMCLPELAAEPFQIAHYKRLGQWLSVTVLVYCVLLSVALTARQSWLEQDVTKLKGAASELVDQQTKLDEQLALITSYHQLFNERTLYSTLLTELAIQLEDVAVVENVSVTGNLVTIRGKAKSATDVLSKLAESGSWQESRFSIPVQTNESGDSFTIATIYSSKTKQVSASTEPSTPEVQP
jgi:Tfp pilus assembly protein PilN